MQLFGIRVFEEQKITARPVKRRAADRLRAVTAVMLTMAAGVPPGFAQQQQSGGVAGAGEKHPAKEASLGLTRLRRGGRSGHACP